MTVLSVHYDNGKYSRASLLAEFVSHLGVRIICLDALPREEVHLYMTPFAPLILQHAILISISFL